MTYEEYKRKRKETKLCAGIDQSTALRLIHYLPKKYQIPHAFFSWVWMLSIPAAILLSIFVKWWIGLVVIFFITPAIYGGTKKSAAQSVLEYAEEDEDFFNQLVEQNLLVFK